MKSLFSFKQILILFLHFTAKAQLMGIYEFSGTGVCPNPYTSVTVQPMNAQFSSYSSVGVNCSATNDVYNNKSWNTTGEINLDEYNEFTLVADSCYNITLTSLTFSHRISNVTSIPTWYLRSSIDDFLTNIDSDISGTNITTVTVSLPASYTNLKYVTFRLYLTSATASNTTWRNDNVSLTGTINPVSPQLFYADSDGDTFGDEMSTISACELPDGYVENNTDCNDLNPQIHPNSIWFEDADQDGFGNLSNTFNGCNPPENYVLDSTDCNDGNSSVTVAANLYYLDNDGDGFGDAGFTQTACEVPVGYVDNGDDCDDLDQTITTAVLLFYEDLDGDGYGNPLINSIECSQTTGFVPDSTDCDDSNAATHPDAIDINGNGTDENCDGVDGFLTIEDMLVNTFQLFPNPSNGIFTIKAQNDVEGFKVSLLTPLGQLVSEQAFSNQLDFSDSEKGIYILQIQTKQEIKNYKVEIR